MIFPGLHLGTFNMWKGHIPRRCLQERERDTHTRAHTHTHRHTCTDTHMHRHTHTHARTHARTLKWQTPHVHNIYIKIQPVVKSGIRWSFEAWLSPFLGVNIKLCRSQRLFISLFLCGHSKAHMLHVLMYGMIY